MLSDDSNWTLTLLLAALAVFSALAGLALATFAPGLAPITSFAVLVVSLGSTAGAFATLVRRVHRLEMENMGLIEEISQEFDRVKDKLEIFGEALEAPRTITPQETESAPLRRVTVK